MVENSSTLGMLPMIIFTIFAVMYHFGHKEYDKRKKCK